VGRGERGRGEGWTNESNPESVLGTCRKSSTFKAEIQKNTGLDGPLSPPIPLYYIHSSSITAHILRCTQPFCTLFYFSCFIFGLTLTHSPRFRIIEDPTDPAIQKGKLSRGLCPPLPWIHAQSHLEAQGTVNLPRVEPSGLKYNQ
jgi:hypothetical protein